MPNKPDTTAQLIYEQNKAANRPSLRETDDELEITIRRIKQNVAVQVVSAVITTRGPDYYVDDAPTGIEDADDDSGIVGFATVRSGSETMPLDGAPSGSRSKLTVDTMERLLIGYGLDSAKWGNSGTNQDGVAWFSTDTGYIYILDGQPSAFWQNIMQPSLGASIPTLRVLGSGALEAAPGNHTH